LPTTLPASPVLTTRLLLLLLSQAITNMTGFPVDCASLPPAWQADAGWLNDQVYCGWRGSDCVLRSPGQRVYLPPAAAAAAGYGEGANGSTQ
jgi:hypothetical protein